MLYVSCLLCLVSSSAPIGLCPPVAGALHLSNLALLFSPRAARSRRLTDTVSVAYG